MSNSIRRMVKRTFGLGEVVQPLTTPVFADEKNIVEDSPGIIPRGKKSSGLTEKNESLPFSEIQEPSVEVEAEKKSTFPKRSKQSKESIITESNIIAKPDKTPDKIINSKGFYENNKNRDRDMLSPQPEKAEKHNRLSTNKKSGVVIPGQMKATENIALSSKQLLVSTNSEEKEKPISRQSAAPENIVLTGKKSMPDVKLYERKVSEIDSSKPTTLINKLQVADGGDHPLASKGFIRSERAGNFEQPIPSRTDRLSEQRRTLSATSTIKVTIGRIDVRAVMQKAESTPLRRVVPPKPKLSLDDYLKQRSGGER